MAPEIETLTTKSIAQKAKKSWKFWLIFWLVSAILLFAWYIFLQIRNRNIENLKPFVKALPIGSERRNELEVMTDIYSKVGGFGGENTFLLLLQNDMELRPGGGFIGAFGILKTKNGGVSDIQIHDTGNFDPRIPDTEQPPYPMGERLHISSWKLRDSNWSPDFRVNAEKAEYFYKLGQGGENFDGIIAVNTDILNSILKITGPLKINDYPGEYSDENAIFQLEYQVEKGYAEQGIAKGDRKSVMKEMANVLAEKLHGLSTAQQFELAKMIEGHLKQKDIQLFFKNEGLQAEVEDMNWGGRVKDFGGNYLMLVDANLNSLKSDYCMRRKIDYQVDLNSDQPTAAMNITYEHTCRTRDWMTTNYNDWARLYVPDGSWLSESSISQPDMRFGKDFGKKVIEFPVYVPVGNTETVTLKYNLPAEIKSNLNSLLIQKQSGSGDLPVKVTVKKADGSVSEMSDILTEDKVFNF